MRVSPPPTERASKFVIYPSWVNWLQIWHGQCATLAKSHCWQHGNTLAITLLFRLGQQNEPKGNFDQFLGCQRMHFSDFLIVKLKAFGCWSEIASVIGPKEGQKPPSWNFRRQEGYHCTAKEDLSSTWSSFGCSWSIREGALFSFHWMCRLTLKDPLTPAFAKN